jgi:hypothetical protein
VLSALPTGINHVVHGLGSAAFAMREDLHIHFSSFSISASCARIKRESALRL